MQSDCLLLGYGDIARRVEQLLTARNCSAALVGRRIDKEERGMALRRAVQADLDVPQSLAVIPITGRPVLYLAPPPQAGELDPRLRNFCAELSNRLPVRPEKVVYVSTSGVYGDCSGALVDEARPVNPQTVRARRRVDAETVLQEWGRANGVPIVILRVAGIYGPGRLPLQRLQAGLPVVKPQQSPFSNRIHAEDLARICLAALDQVAVQGVFNVCDGEQSRMSDYFIAVARHFGLPEPSRIDLSEARQQFSAEMLSYLNESRQLDNRRLLRELNITLLYPTLAAGLKAIKQSFPNSGSAN